MIFPNWGLMVWLGLGENVPRSWVSRASFRFVTVPGAYCQELETTSCLVLPRQRNLNYTLLAKRSNTDQWREQAMILSFGLFIWTRASESKVFKISSSAKLIAAYIVENSIYLFILVLIYFNIKPLGNEKKSTDLGLDSGEWMYNIWRHYQYWQILC